MSWVLRVLLTLLPLVIILYLYAGWRINVALAHLTAWPRRARRAGTSLVILLLLLYPVLLLCAELLSLPALAHAMREGNTWIRFAFVVPFWTGMIVVGESVPWLLSLQVTGLVLHAVARRAREAWLRAQAVLILVLCAGMIAYVVFKIVRDTTTVRLVRHEVPIPGLPPDLEGLRLVQLSDLQADPFTGASIMQRYIDLANGQLPDLTLFGGDLVTRGTQHIAAGAAMMGRLHARFGVYACLGDHDYWAAPGEILQQLRNAGIVAVEDTVLSLSVGHSSLSLTILTNIYNRRPSDKVLARLYHQRPAHAAVHLLLTHQPTPEVVAFARDHGYHLLLAGHTHGGQIVLRPFGVPVTASLLETPYFSGVSRVGDLTVSTTNGLGLTLAPFRYRAPAEVTLLVLKAGP